MAFFFIVVFIVIALIWFNWLLPKVYGLSGKHGRLNVLNRIARVFKGQTIQPRNGVPYVLIRVHGQLYRVAIRSGAGQARVPQNFLNISAVMNANDQSADGGKPFQMSLTLERFERKKVRVPDLELGKPDFDRCFYIRTNDEKRAVETLTSQTQHLIHDIHLQAAIFRFELHLAGRQIQLDKGISIDESPAKLFRMIRLFVDLHQSLSETQLSLGQIEIEQVLLRDTVCLICGETVADPKVTCSSCETEYHLDCWNYIGQCGRYACGGTKYLAGGTQGGTPAQESDEDLFRIDE